MRQTKQKAFFLVFGKWLLVLGFIVNLSVIPAIASERNVPIKNLHLPSQNSQERTEEVTHVMIHYISNAVAKPQDPYHVQDIYRIFVDSGVSAHYMIGRDGTIYQLVDEGRVAYHAGKGNLPKFPAYQDKMNEYSIGIELLAIGTRNEMLPIMSGEAYDLISASHIGYTDAQYRSLNRLLNDIFKRYPAVQKDRKHVIGHDEYAPDRKTDPGELFDWSRIDLSQPVQTDQSAKTEVKDESMMSNVFSKIQDWIRTLIQMINIT